MENIGIMILWWGILLMAIYPISWIFAGHWWVSPGSPWMKNGVPLIHLGISLSGILVNYLGRWLKVYFSGNYLKDILSGK